MKVFAMVLVGMVGVVSLTAGGDMSSDEAQCTSVSVRDKGAPAEPTVEPFSLCSSQIHLYQDCQRCCNNDKFVFSDEEYCNCDGIRPAEE